LCRNIGGGHLVRKAKKALELQLSMRIVWGKTVTENIAVGGHLGEAEKI
jgi:hypothetical protein